MLVNFTVTPVLADTENSAEKRYRIGFQNTAEMKTTRLPFTQALSRSLDENKKGSVLILQLVRKLVQHKVSMRTISGPIGIAQDGVRLPGAVRGDGYLQRPGEDFAGAGAEIAVVRAMARSGD